MSHIPQNKLIKLDWVQHFCSGLPGDFMNIAVELIEHSNSLFASNPTANSID